MQLFLQRFRYFAHPSGASSVTPDATITEFRDEYYRYHWYFGMLDKTEELSVFVTHDSHTTDMLDTFIV
jgi:hypothetical protein